MLLAAPCLDFLSRTRYRGGLARSWRSCVGDKWGDFERYFWRMLQMPLHCTLLGRSNHCVPIASRKFIRQLHFEPDSFNQAGCRDVIVLDHADVINGNSPLPTETLHVGPSACTNRRQKQRER